VLDVRERSVASSLSGTAWSVTLEATINQQTDASAPSTTAFDKRLQTVK
jgi:hypothetical protein